MNETAARTEQVMVRLTPDMLAALKAHAAINERTVAQTVRLAVQTWLEGQRKRGTNAAS